MSGDDLTSPNYIQLPTSAAASNKISIGYMDFEINPSGASSYTHIIPWNSNTSDLGSSSKLFRNLYLKGNLSDGTNSTTIASIVAGLTTNVKSGKKSDGSTDISGSKSGTIITLGDSGITAGTYSAIQVNAKGIAVAGGQILDVIAHGGTPNVVNGGWYFEELAAA